MRMSQEKVRDLAHQIALLLRDDPKVELLVAENAIRVAVGSAILDDLEEEDDIDREVDEILRQHAREIEKDDMDLHQLRLKFKQEIARRRGFIL